MAWLWVGTVFGFVILIFSFIISFLAFAFSEKSFFSLHLLSYALSAYIAHAFSKKMRAFFEIHHAKTDKLDQDSNTIKADIVRERTLSSALQKKYERYRSLKDVTQTLGTQLSLDEASKYSLDRAYTIINKGDAAMLYFLEPRSQTLALKNSITRNESIKIRSKLGDIFDNWVLKKHTPLIVDDVKKDYRFNLGEITAGEHLYTSVIAAPLMTERRVLGVMRLDSPKAAGFTPDDLRLLDILSDLSAAAIKNCMLYLKTQELAIRDSLTGLFVHRYFKQRLKEEILRAGKTNIKTSLIMLDIDYFKDYNDKYGHTAGDIVLKNVAQILREKSQPGDLVARYGGEEFTLILPGADKEKAMNLAEAIRRQVGSTYVVLRREETHITVSLGVASFPQDAREEDGILKLADARLYKAKQAGKNKVCGE
ncbi:MAG: sensor domain-containing diguanylate cyclase [Candidatus Omnitrophota bacterium]